MPYTYRFPNGKWSVEDYESAKGSQFTGHYWLQVSGVPGNPTHYKAITVQCDDAEFVSELLAFLNRNNQSPETKN